MTRSLEAEARRFNRLYGQYAFTGMTAFQSLQQMKREGWLGVDMALHFHVSQGTISEWNKKFFPKVDSLS